MWLCLAQALVAVALVGNPRWAAADRRDTCRVPIAFLMGPDSDRVIMAARVPSLLLNPAGPTQARRELRHDLDARQQGSGAYWENCPLPCAGQHVLAIQPVWH
jgi:hypothetical protein